MEFPGNPWGHHANTSLSRNGRYPQHRVNANKEFSILIMDDFGQYLQPFDAFLKLTGYRKRDFACLRRNLPAALEKLQLGKDKQTLSVLSIGAGDGVVDQEILDIVEEGYLNKDSQLKNVEIINTGVEPLQSCATKYNESFQRRSRSGSSKRSVKFEFKPMTFEDYVQSKHDPHQYDLIQAIHSLYYVDSIESTLNHCYQHELGNEGLIVCAQLSQGCSFNLIKEALNKNRTEENKKKPLRETGDIVRLAEKHRWEFDRFKYPLIYDVTGILNETTQDGKLLLDFLTMENDFLDTADKESIDNVLKTLKDLSSKDDDGRLVVNDANELTIIYKT